MIEIKGSSTRLRDVSVHQARFADIPPALWNAVVPAERRTPMHLWDWAATSLDAYGDRAKAKVLVIGDPDAPEALVPLMRRPGAAGWYSLLGNEGGAVEVPRRSDDTIPVIAEAIVRLGHPVTLGDYPIDSPLVGAIRRAARGHATVMTRPVGEKLKPWLDLDETWRDPAAHLKKKLASSIRRRERRLLEKGTLHTRFERPTVETAGAMLDIALAVEASGWKSRAGIALATDPRQDTFFRAYCSALARDGRLHITLLQLDETPIAMSIGELYGDTYWAHKTGYDERFAKFAPGILKQYYLIRHLAETEVGRIDFQGRMDAFKRTWTDRGVDATKVRVYPFNSRGVLAMTGDAAKQARMGKSDRIPH